jgi:hypothetical protein
MGSTVTGSFKTIWGCIDADETITVEQVMARGVPPDAAGALHDLIMTMLAESRAGLKTLLELQDLHALKSLSSEKTLGEVERKDECPNKSTSRGYRLETA